MSRDDPKPGRWILPLVVAGIIGFTYVFVNALPPAPVTETTQPPASETTLLPDATTTTTTTIPPAFAAFVADLDALETQANELLTEAQQINDDWDNENATFRGTEDRFIDYEGRVAEYAAAVEAVAPPPVVTNWANASGAAGAMATASVNMREGFQDPDSAAGRRSGLADLQAAGEELLAAFTAARAAVAG